MIMTSRLHRRPIFNSPTSTCVWLCLESLDTQVVSYNVDTGFYGDSPPTGGSRSGSPLSTGCLSGGGLASQSADSIQFIIHYRRRWRPGLCLDSAAGNKRPLARAHARGLRHVLACADARIYARTRVGLIGVRRRR